MHIAVTGSHGLIGRALTTALTADGHRVIPLVRTAAGSPPAAIGWDPSSGFIDREKLAGVDAVVHLAGAGIGDRRWTAARRREILESRTRGTALVAETLATLDHKPSVLVSASAVGYYGPRGDEVLTETSPPGDGFLSEVCVAWEAATAAATAAGIRVVHLRTGVVLSPDGGALAKTLPLFRSGLGGRLGPGRQWWSWISLVDEVAAIRWLIRHHIAGPVNLTAPTPITNREYTKVLGRVLHRPAVVPVPRFAPKLLLGAELADQLLFSSQRVEPSVLLREGFEFTHPTLEPALRDLLKRPSPTRARSTGSA